MTESAKDRSDAKGLLAELIRAVNNQWVSIAWVLMIHFATLTFEMKNMLFYNTICFMGIVCVKLVQYCRFMDSQNW